MLPKNNQPEEFSEIKAPSALACLLAYRHPKASLIGMLSTLEADAFSAKDNGFSSLQRLLNLALPEAHKTEAANFGLQPFVFNVMRSGSPSANKTETAPPPPLPH
ncbi:hypothetical protein [Comamonas sp. JNW]|uniref:hypothetical protein n=1 Tax=Comamonas sp. JNW TaxID=2170731 RepID=UPI001058174D|nr:hypothetical protein [Comamonas sp. JNW]